VDARIASLTPREREIMGYVASGLNYSTEDIAKALGITVNTVLTHRNRILKTLGAHSMAQAVAIYLRNGWG
jgi:DNA-binding CsgD family transcriptional regulator